MEGKLSRQNPLPSCDRWIQGRVWSVVLSDRAKAVDATTVEVDIATRDLVMATFSTSTTTQHQKLHGQLHLETLWMTAQLLANPNATHCDA